MWSFPKIASLLPSYLQSDLKRVRAHLRREASVIIERELFSSMGRNEGFWQNRSSGKGVYLALKDRQGDQQEGPLRWARSFPFYNPRVHLVYAFVPRMSNTKIHYFLIDKAGVVAHTSARVRQDEAFPHPRKIDFLRDPIEASD